MQIVIDLPDENYQVTLTKIMLACRGFNIIELPKGHGRLKDVDWIDDNCEGHYSDKDGSWCYTWKDIDDAPTIIEKEDGNEGSADNRVK